MKVLLIGGAGFIGHNLALELAQRGATVEVVDGLQVNNLLALSNEAMPEARRALYLRMLRERLRLLREAGVRLRVLDAREQPALAAIVARAAPDTVVQLAAVSHAGRSNQDPGATFDHSLRTLQHALDAARGSGAHFVFFSSSMVYGNFDAASVDEDHPLRPIGVYGALKLAGEKMVHAYHQVFGMPYTIVRPSALYGPRCVSRRVAQVFIENALEGRALRVEGDGEERVDFTYIDDLVDGVCRVIESPAARNQTFNITYGGSRSVAELVAAVRSRFPEAAVQYAPRDRLMPMRGTLCVDRARELLGYQPRYGIEKGVPAYVDWYRGFVDTERAKRAPLGLPRGKGKAGLLELSR
jgi:nucleoside-diphosphate-sugar epimerase